MKGPFGYIEEMVHLVVDGEEFQVFVAEEVVGGFSFL